jgi:hypothetical protein
MAKYTKAQAEKDGWVIIPVREEARAVKAGITGGGHTEFVVEEALFRAEKTQNDHLITEQAVSEEKLLEAIESRQASLDNALPGGLTVPVLNDQAGDAGGEKNVGVGGILTASAVQKPDAVRELEEQVADGETVLS